MRETNEQRPTPGTSSDLSAREVLVPLFRRKKTLLVTFVLVFGIVMLLALIQGPFYSARMAILVNRERLDPLVSTEATMQVLTNGPPVAPEEVNSEMELITSRDVLEKVVVANGLDKPHQRFSLIDLIHPHQTRDDRVARAVKTLAKKIETNVTTKTNVIEVTYSSSDPQLCYGVLKSLGDAYTAKHVAVHRPTGSYEFFARETQKYQADLEDAETRLRNFSRQNGVAAPDVQRTNLALQAAESVGLQHVAEQAIAADTERIQDDQEQMKATPQRSATTQASAAADKLLGDLYSSLLAAQTKRTQLALKYDAQYPLVREADQEIAQTKAAISQAEGMTFVSQTTDRDPTFELVREDLAKTRADLGAQRANLTATKRSVQSIQEQMVVLDQQSIAQQDLLREAKAAENNYLLYLAKREQERTNDALDNTRIANVAIAVPPAIPVLPTLGWSTIIVMAFGVAVSLGVGLAYGMDYLDSSFHTPAQVIDILRVPVVITVAKKTA
jgi:polysaccharide biosynthesis protein PslE